MFINNYSDLLNGEFNQSADVWRFDSGEIFVGFLNEGEEATWIGTVADIVEEIS